MKIILYSWKLLTILNRKFLSTHFVLKKKRYSDQIKSKQKDKGTDI